MRQSVTSQREDFSKYLVLILTVSFDELPRDEMKEPN